MMRTLCLLVLVACGHASPNVSLDNKWPTQVRDYDDVTEEWTRKTSLRDQYQEIADIAVVFRSPEWRASHATRDANNRHLTGEARDQVLAQAQAAAAGPYEVELLVTTWDRRENDLDRGKKSVWRVVLIGEDGKEIEPLEIVKDKRPTFTIRADYPVLGDFATAYVARFPPEAPVLGPNVRKVRLVMSSARGGLEVTWDAK